MMILHVWTCVCVSTRAARCASDSLSAAIVATQSDGGSQVESGKDSNSFQAALLLHACLAYNSLAEYSTLLFLPLHVFTDNCKPGHSAILTVFPPGCLFPRKVGGA